MTSSKELKAFGFTFECKEAEGDMIVEGYGSTFGNKDHGGDIVLRGAFAESLTKRSPKMLWQHNSGEPIGVWLEAREDNEGLYLKGKILPTALGKDAYTLLKAGAIDTMSIGYRVTEQEYTQEDSKSVRLIKKCELYEVSLVTFPMNEMAKVTSVKSELPDNVRDFELFLRDAGYSRADARAIASCGFKEAEYLRDAENAALIASLNSVINKLKG
jgi:HK97 family phage prohead protease